MRKDIVIKIIVPICATILISACAVFYYFQERHIEFQLIQQFKTSANYYSRSFYTYADNQDAFLNQLSNSLTDGWESDSDSLSLIRLVQELDYVHYCYIITYNKKLLKLSYSPYLRSNYDDLYYDGRMPLIPTYQSYELDSLFLYSIPKNSHYRAPGP